MGLWKRILYKTFYSWNCYWYSPVYNTRWNNNSPLPLCSTKDSCKLGGEQPVKDATTKLAWALVKKCDLLPPHLNYFGTQHWSGYKNGDVQSKDYCILYLVLIVQPFSGIRGLFHVWLGERVFELCRIEFPRSNAHRLLQSPVITN